MGREGASQQVHSVGVPGTVAIVQPQGQGLGGYGRLGTGRNRIPVLKDRAPIPNAVIHTAGADRP